MGGFGAEGERAVVPDDSILSIERLEPCVAEPAVVVHGPAVRQGLEQERRDPRSLVTGEDFPDRCTDCRFEDAEPDRAAEVASACRSPAKHKRTVDFFRLEPRVSSPVCRTGR